MMALFRFLKNYYRSILVFLVILFLSTISGDNVPGGSLFQIPNFDKIVHLLMYLSLAVIIGYDILKNNVKFSIQKTMIIVILMTILYGGLLELVQEYLTTTRSGDWMDFLFNSLGVILSIPLFLLPKWRNRNPV
jgi:VanZ family protein